MNHACKNLKNNLLCVNIYIFFIHSSWFYLCVQAVQISLRMCKNLFISLTMLCICVCVSVSVWDRVGELPVCFGRFALCSGAQRTGVYGLISSEDWISTPSCRSWALIVLSACGLLPNSPQNGHQSPSATLRGPLYYRSRLLRPVFPALPLFTLPAAY